MLVRQSMVEDVAKLEEIALLLLVHQRLTQRLSVKEEPLLFLWGMQLRLRLQLVPVRRVGRAVLLV